MAALGADINVSTQNTPDKVSYPAIADTFYKGALVFKLEAGGNVSPVPVAEARFVGISTKKQVIATAGDLLEVYSAGWFETPLGANIAAEDDSNLFGMDATGTLSDNIADTVSFEIAADDIALAANDIIVGRIMHVYSASMLIYINPALSGKYDATTTAGLLI